MNAHRSRLALVALVTLSLCGCSAAESPSAGGIVELALSETCTEGSDAQCILVGGEHVMRPDAYEPAAVEEAVVSESPQNAVDIAFTAEGAAVVNDLTGQAAEAGDESRLVLRIGDEILAAVAVMEPLAGDQVTIALSPEDDAQEVVELLRGS